MKYLRGGAIALLFIFGLSVLYPGGIPAVLADLGLQGWAAYWDETPDQRSPAPSILQTDDDLVLPDLAVASVMRSEGMAVPPVGEGTVYTIAGSMSDNGSCDVPLEVDLVNIGGGVNEPFSVGLYHLGELLQQTEIAKLRSGDGYTLQMNVELKNGPHRLKLVVDDRDQLKEKDEANNVAVVRLIVRGCGFDSMES